DNVNSTFVQDYELDPAALFLPMLRGYGILPDLHIAMSIDNDGGDPDSLISLVGAFAGESLTDLITDDNTGLDAVKDILFRWAGVDGVEPGSRGPNIDGRELEFIEKLTGQDFRQLGYYADPYYYAAQPLKEAFDIALNNFAARLIGQVIGKDLFEGDFHYN